MRIGQIENPVFTYSDSDLGDFIEGATFLATGGGGPRQVAYNLLKNSGVTSVNLIAAPYIPDEMTIAMVAQVFAPSDIWANPDYQSSLNSYQTLIRPSGQSAVLPVEVGAVNGIVPAIVAGKTNSYLIADTQIDRSMSEMDMALFQMKVPFSILQMVTKQGTVVPQKKYPTGDVDAMIVEQDILDIMKEYPEFQGVGGFATYAMTGRDLNRLYTSGLLFSNTYDYARRLGACMEQADFESRILGEIKHHLGPALKPYPLFKGYLVQSVQQAHAQDYGYADFITSDPESAMGARVYYSNENMMATRLLWVLVRGVPTPLELGPMAIGPDALCYLLMEGDSQAYQKGHSFTNEDFGQDHGDPDFFRTHEIQFIGIPEAPLRRLDIIANYTREIKRIMEAFGRTYSGNYIPIEKLNTLAPVFDMPRQKRSRGGDSFITMSSPVKNGIIRYTLDGSDPDPDSLIFSTPIALSEVLGKKIKARLYYDSHLAGLTTMAGFDTL